MMRSGFIITELQLQSTSELPAIVKFHKGLNIITGPSSTGKTYIYQCINYMLGSSVPPKAINQAAPYQLVLMNILANNGDPFTLKSDLKGGDIFVSGPSLKQSMKLARKHNPESDETISAFLLKLNNLFGRKIRMNAAGKTRTVSYRDVVRYLMVEETRIITDESPILSGQFTKATEEKSTFKLILSGQDDSDIIESISKDEIKYRKGKIEMLTELIADNNKELYQFANSVAESQIARVDENIEELKTEHNRLNSQFAELDSQRSAITIQLSTVGNQKMYTDEILIRSTILKQQYLTDLERLNSTIEASFLLLDNPMLEENCPVCASPLGEKNIEPELQSVINACQKEITKLGSLINEVNESEAILKEESEDYFSSIIKLQSEKNQITKSIDDGVAVEMNAIFDKISILNGLKANLTRALFVQEKTKILEDQKQRLQSSIVKKITSFEDLLTSRVSELANTLNEILKSCKYPDIRGVTYSETKNDFVISGEDRELAGKGFRAITYAAFIIALQELLYNKSYSIGPTILDSPLVTYRKPSADGEGIQVDLAMDFYRYLATNTKVDQVIIMENEEPPADIAPNINHITFTGSHVDGRYGFIPS